MLFSDHHEPPLVERFRNFVREPDFPCVGAKSALSKGQLRIVVAQDIRSAWDDLQIHAALVSLAQDYRAEPKLFQSLVVLFENYQPADEVEFEALLWERIQSLSDKDEWRGQRPDPRVSEDPVNPHFSLSFGGEAFFVVGLHPSASRPARRFDVPAMVYNLHDQFEQLRSAGVYEKLRSSILARDLASTGTSNPMLASHGSMSEARQYSGRAVDADWVCPFNRDKRTLSDVD